MLKSVLFCALLWHAVCEFSSRAESFLTNTSVQNIPMFVSSRINDADVQVEPNVNYIFNITPIFYLKGPLFGTSDFGRNLTSTDDVSMARLSREESNQRSQSSSPEAQLTQSKATCPGQIHSKEGYVVMDGIGAHKLHTEAHTWSEAKQICIDEGGHLAVLRSKSEHSVIFEMLEKKFDKSTSVWMGLRYQCETQTWISVFGEPLLESGWMRESAWEMQKYANWECATYSLSCDDYGYSNDNGMSSQFCNKTLPFVCKITNI